MGLDTIELLEPNLHQHVVECKPSHKHTNLSPPPSFRYLSRILHGLPANLKKHTLLWIHQGRFTGRNPKKLTIETVNIIYLPRPSCSTFAYCPPYWMVVVFHRPSLGKNFRHSIHTIHQHIPKIGRIICISRESATNTNNCNAITHRQISQTQ